MENSKGDALREKSKKQNQPKHHAAKTKEAVKMRRKKIIKALVEGKTLQQAGEIAGLSPKTAHSQVSVILTEPNTKAAFKALLDAAVPDSDLSAKYRELMNATKVISAMVMAGDGMKDAGGMTKDFIEVPDSPTQLRTADSIAKLKGHMVDRIMSDVNGNLADMMRVYLAGKK